MKDKFKQYSENIHSNGPLPQQLKSLDLDEWKTFFNIQLSLSDFDFILRQKEVLIHVQASTGHFKILSKSEFNNLEQQVLDTPKDAKLKFLRQKIHCMIYLDITENKISIPLFLRHHGFGPPIPEDVYE
jgi:hypothetical protein